MSARVPKVWNKRDPDVPPDAVYVGRPSLYGNPFKIGQHGDRARVLYRYRFEVLAELTTAQLDLLRANLRGKDLVCWCAPLPCHADLLLQLANE
jgi:hypothetical protein